MTAKKKPNFLYIMTDQHRADWLGCAGHPVVKTPNIDGLADKGVRFENFHVASPICMPNRASIFTGRFPSVHGLRSNGALLSTRANTFIDVLAADGYVTASLGKSHLQPFTGERPLGRVDRPENQPIAEAWRTEDGDYSLEEAEHYTENGRFNFPVPYYGFQEVDMVTRHGDACGGHYEQWFRAKAGDQVDALLDRANQLPHSYTCPQAYRTPIPAELYTTSYIADSAISFFERHKESEQPFFAFVSFPDPHHPFNPPGKYWDMYQPEQFEQDLPFEAHRNPLPSMEWMKKNYEDGGKGLTFATGIYANTRECLEAKALTAGMITCLDDAIGRMMASLVENGLDEDTIVIFNSDHGDYLGDYNMLLKAFMPFRSITNVPFIWRDPYDDQEGVVRHQLASSVDIGATILERAGLAPYNGYQGESLLDTIQLDTAHRDSLYIEFNDSFARLGLEKAARTRAVVDLDYRFTYYANSRTGELYDLNADPKESKNLWDSPKHATVRAHYSERLNTHLTYLMDMSPEQERLA